MNKPQKWAEDDFIAPLGVTKLNRRDLASGRKYIMFHGTTKKNAQSILKSGFHQSEDGMLGRGVYLSRDLKKARRYPIDHPESDKVIIKVSVNVGKVITIRNQDHPHQKTWHDSAHGDVYDTAWVPPDCGMVKSGLEEACVWDPDRIEIIKTIKPPAVKHHLQLFSSWIGLSYSGGHPLSESKLTDSLRWLPDFENADKVSQQLWHQQEPAITVAGK